MTMTRHYQNTYRKRLLEKIERMDGQVFTRKDLTKHHSNQEQLRLNRALKAFMHDGFIIKISHGLYAKATKMVFPNGDTKIVLRDAFESVVMEALNKLGIDWELGHALQDYNRGKTTQVPVVFTVKLKSRFRGTIRAEGKKVRFEEGINAR